MNNREKKTTKDQYIANERMYRQQFKALISVCLFDLIYFIAFVSINT